MIDLEQKVYVVWNPTTRKHYEQLGYRYTKYGDKFLVTVKNLLPTSTAKVSAFCDYCGDEVQITYGGYNHGTKNQTVKCACYKCVSYKAFEYSDERKELYEEFLNICTKFNFTPITTFEEFVYRKQELIYICPVHGQKQNTLDSLRRFQYGCHECGNAHKGEYAVVQTEQLMQECAAHGYIILNPEEYINTYTKNLQVICKECGQSFLTSRASIKLSNGRCKECGKRTLVNSPEKIKEVIESINNNKWLNPDEYVGSQVGNLRILCGTCGVNEFTTSFGRYTCLDVTRCSICSHSTSKGELLVMDILNKYNIEYIPEKRYSDCKDKTTLPFDFYLPEYNKIIEFDGHGHFEPVHGEDKLELTRRHDNIKNEYCKLNHIDLLRIPYWESSNAEAMIINFLNLKPHKLIIKYNKNPYE